MDLVSQFPIDMVKYEYQQAEKSSIDHPVHAKIHPINQLNHGIFCTKGSESISGSGSAAARFTIFHNAHTSNNKKICTPTTSEYFPCFYTLSMFLNQFLWPWPVLQPLPRSASGCWANCQPLGFTAAKSAGHNGILVWKCCGKSPIPMDCHHFPILWWLFCEFTQFFRHRNFKFPTSKTSKAIFSYFSWIFEDFSVVRSHWSIDP